MNEAAVEALAERIYQEWYDNEMCWGAEVFRKLAKLAAEAATKFFEEQRWPDAHVQLTRDQELVVGETREVMESFGRAFGEAHAKLVLSLLDGLGAEMKAQKAPKAGLTDPREAEPTREKR